MEGLQYFPIFNFDSLIFNLLVPPCSVSVIAVPLIVAAAAGPKRNGGCATRVTPVMSVRQSTIFRTVTGDLEEVVTVEQELRAATCGGYIQGRGGCFFADMNQNFYTVKV